MNNLSLLMDGFATILTWNHLMIMVIGVMLGMLVGVLPGLGAPNGVSLLLPLTFTMDPVSAIILLSCMYWGALFGGSTTSILFNIPGEPSSVATTFDGYPMARNGEATRALTLAFMAAGLGALAGVVMITLLANWVAQFGLKFSSPEYFAVYFLAFCSFIGMSSSAPSKTLVSMMLGLAFATVGMDSVSGGLRLTFGIPDLVKGISFLVAVMGLFGIAELMVTTEEGLSFKGIKSRIRIMDILRTMAELPRYWVSLVRSILIGIWMGITPAGPTAASFMSHGIAKRFSKHPERFGKGEPNGIVSPEAADHSAGTSALLPMLALGVPGSATAAVMMGGLMIWGLTPGPMLFVTRPDFVWGLIASMYLGNVVAVVLVLATVPLYASILRVPFAIIGPVIVAVIFTGVYQVANSTFDFWLLLFFALLGYLFKKLDYPVAPLVLTMVLGHRAEEAFRQSMVMSDGSLTVFWSNSLVSTIMGLGVLMLAWPLISRMLGLRGWRQRLQRQKPQTPKSPTSDSRV